MLLHVMEPQSKYSVIIVGAGISGISAAKILVENNVNDILILEADDRIGGRMKKEEFSGWPVEVGAAWISGVGGRLSNPVWELANQCNIRTCFTDATSSRYNVYDTTSGERTVAADQYEEAINTYNMGSTVECKTPIESAIDFVLHDFEIPDVWPSPTFEHFGKKEFMVADQKGYEYMVYRLAESFLHTKDEKIMDSRLKLNKVVREVEYTKRGVLIRTEDGCSFKAKYAILSVSLGVLQSELIHFRPQLPAWKVEAIKKCEMKVFTKIFLKFPYTFWPCDPQSDFFIYTHERRGYYTLWQHMETIYPGSSILVVTVTNEESKRVEAQGEEETLKETMEVLRSMFGHQIPDPLDILIPRWWNNKFQRGSYSNYPLHHTSRFVHDIKAPIDNIYFTGEHTSEKFSGYVHGAYLAGVDTGTTILKEMGLKNNDGWKMKINCDQARVLCKELDCIKYTSTGNLKNSTVLT